ncbi:MAG: cupredoxin domain-containing protein [Thermoanaerobaculia bacterium]|jgi:plastocyanin
MKRSALIIAVSLIMFSVLAAGTKNRKPKTYTVVMAAMEFRPALLTVNSGDTIVWDNRDIVAHTATSTTAGGFDSKMIRPGESWRYTIRTKGDIAYLCAYHPTMKGTLVVK